MKRSILTLMTGALLVLWQSSAAHALTLDAVLQATAAKNPEIQKAKLDLERAYGRRLVFRSVGLPDASLGTAGGVQGGYRAGERSTQPFGFAYGGITQPLFNAAVPASRRRGDVEVLIAQQRLNVAMVEHLHSARVAFYTGLYNRSLKQVREEQQERLQQISISQKARYEAGLTERGVFVGAETQSRELVPRIDAAQRAYDGAVIRDVELMGDDLTGKTPLPKLEGELTYRPIALDIDAEAKAALAQRADLKLARLLVRAADEDQRIIEADYYPAINATAAGEYIPVSGVRRESEGSPHRSDDVISSEIRAGVAYTWRVVDNGRTHGALITQRSAREINEITLRKLEADVPRQLSRINNDLQGIATNQASLAAATEAAEQSAVSTRENLAGGVISQFEFRLAENASLEIKTTLLGLAYQQSLALAERDRATGRYFQFSDDSRQNMQ